MVSRALLPNGIINITLFNNHGEPINERLFFNFNESEILNITAKTDKIFYTQRDKTTLNALVTMANNEPVEANISTLVIDKNQLRDSRISQPHILSYFLLNSELKGFIEDPRGYFGEDNRYNKHDLEALMLTQGWSNYVFNKKEANYNFKIKPETDLWVSGTVRSTLNKNKATKGVELTMLTFGKPQGIFIQEIDSLGRFTFNLNNQYADKLNMVIQSKNKIGIAKDYNIELDKASRPPKVIYEENETVALADTIIKPFLEKSIAQKKQQNGFNLSSNTIELNTVQLTGYNVTPEREKIFKLHGAPDVVIKTEDLEKAQEKWMFGLYSILKYKFPDDIAIEKVGYRKKEFILLDTAIAILVDPTLKPEEGEFLDFINLQLEIANVRGSAFTFILIDGILVNIRDYRLLASLAVEQIKSFEILKHPKVALKYFDEFFAYPLTPGANAYSIISIYTYSGKGLAGLSPTRGIFKGVISGFATPREFYAPKYENLETEDWNIPDLRSVVHWEPNITTDLDGNAQVEFYNADNTGDMVVIVEAITPDGKIGYYETTYRVEEKLEK